MVRQAQALTGEVVECRRANHRVPGARETVSPELIERDQQDVGWCSVAAHSRQNTWVKLWRRALTLLVTTALVLNVGVATTSAPSVARADVPEITWCKSDAGLAIGSTGSRGACLQFTLAAPGLYHGMLTQKEDKVTGEAMAIFQSNNPPLPVGGAAAPPAPTPPGV